MNNLLLKLKRFLGNKNTITILGVIAGVAVLLFGYSYRVKQAVNPVSIPYALARMQPKSKVELENVGTIKVSGAFVDQTADLVTTMQYMQNTEWYVNYDTVIPNGGLFYKSQLVTKDKIPDTFFDDIPEGATVFSLGVDSHSTYANSIMPDNYIDLYIRATDETGKVIFGKFIESIKVLAVRDSGGNDVFADSQAIRSSSELIFAVKNDFFMILSEANFVGGIQIIPVPRNKAYRVEGEDEGTRVSREVLVNFIMEKVSELSDEINIDEIIQGSTPSTTVDENNNNNE